MKKAGGQSCVGSRGDDHGGSNGSKKDVERRTFWAPHPPQSCPSARAAMHGSPGAVAENRAGTEKIFEGGRAMSAADAKAVESERELTDGFHLIIDALKLNGVKTIYGVPGIPITDFGRMAQAAGIRVLSFRHEQNAGNAAAIAGFLTKQPGICLTVSAPGFLNGLTALANATTNCFPMVLISGSSEREIVDLQQ